MIAAWRARKAPALPVLFPFSALVLASALIASKQGLCEERESTLRMTRAEAERRGGENRDTAEVRYHWLAG